MKPLVIIKPAGGGQRDTKKRKLYNGMIKCDYYMYTDNQRKKGK